MNTRKQSGYMFISADLRTFFFKSLISGNLAVKSTTKQREAFIWFPQNVFVFWNVLTVWQFFPQNIQNKEDILMDCKTKFIVVVIRCNLVFYAFFAEIPHPKNTHWRKYWDFFQIRSARCMVRYIFQRSSETNKLDFHTRNLGPVVKWLCDHSDSALSRSKGGGK